MQKQNRYDPNYQGPLSETKHNQNRRAWFQDYCEPGFYMFTFKKRRGVPDFSHLVGSPFVREGSGAPNVALHPIGEIIEQEIVRTGEMRYGSVFISNYVIMPDHVHILVRVLTYLKTSITRVIGLIESTATKICRKQGLIGEADCAFSDDGINDRIVYKQGQLDVLFKYIDDNPRRLMVKRMFPDLFRHQLGVMIDDLEMDCVGNIFLLRKPLMAVHVRRAWSEQQVAAYEKECAAHVANGGVLISPYIHPRERGIMKAAIEAGGSVVMIKDRGFGERWKPAGTDFDLCAGGRLLVMVESGSSMESKEDMSYGRASHMNRIAESIAACSGERREMWVRRRSLGR